MKMRPLTNRFLLLAACAWGGLGCSSGPRNTPVDAAKAREVLRTALESWKRGERADALQSASPAIHVIDPQWQEGVALLDFRIAGDGKEMDAQLTCPVVLTVRDRKGKQINQEVTFYVSTAPNFTVARKLFSFEGHPSR
jgi:hypothetical protein